MRQLIFKLGRLNSVIVITVVSILLSVILTLVVTSVTQGNENIFPAIFVSIIIPLIVAPLTSWPLIGLLFKIDGLEKEMRRLATYDSLTGVLTRQAFLHDTMNDIAFCEREQMLFCILALDLDKFKNINDDNIIK